MDTAAALLTALSSGLGTTAFQLYQHCLWNAAALPLGSGGCAVEIGLYCPQRGAPMRLEGGGSVFRLRQPLPVEWDKGCLRSRALLPCKCGSAAYEMRQCSLQQGAQSVQNAVTLPV